MADRDDVLDAARAAGAEPTMLPSGTEVQLELPSVAGLLSRGVLPPALRQIALRFASDEGVAKSQLDEAEAARMDELERVMIADAVHAIRPPNFDQWVPIRLDPDELAIGRRRLAEIDYEALQHLVLRIRSPRQVDAMSRLAHGQMEAEEAAAIVEAERVNTLAGWASFRGLGRGADAGSPGAHVGRPPVQPADHLGSGGRVRDRRRPAPPPARGPAQHTQGG